MRPTAAVWPARVRCEISAAAEETAVLREPPRSSLVTCVKQHGCDMSALLMTVRHFDRPCSPLLLLLMQLLPTPAAAASSDHRPSTRTHSYSSVGLYISINMRSQLWWQVDFALHVHKFP